MKLKPIFDRVVLKPQKQEQVTLSGLVLPATSDNAVVCGCVIAVGDGTNLDGTTCKMRVDVGDKVVYSKYAGVEYKADGEDYIILRQTDILAVVEN